MGEGEFLTGYAVAAVLTRAPPRDSTLRVLNWWMASSRSFVVKLKGATPSKASSCCTRLVVAPALDLDR